MLSNKKLRITIIIPMYNEAKNIRQCLNVLWDQVDQNFSVVFIDDGSTDNTVELLKNGLKQNPTEFQYEILQQSNQGAAQARETGIHACQTEYILILDCDDRISPDAIKLHYRTIAKYSPDIIMPKMKIQQKDNSYRDFQFFDDQICHDGLICLEQSLYHWKTHGCVCAKRDIFLKSYEIYRQYNPNDENYMNNDEVLVRLHFLNAAKVVKNDAVYFYENNEASTTKRINPNRYLIGKNVIILYKLFGNSTEGNIAFKMQLEYINILWELLQYLKAHRKSLPNYQQWIDQIGEMVDFIRPYIKNFKYPSFKIWYRLSVVRVFIRLLLISPKAIFIIPS